MSEIKMNMNISNNEVVNIGSIVENKIVYQKSKIGELTEIANGVGIIYDMGKFAYSVNKNIQRKIDLKNSDKYGLKALELLKVDDKAQALEAASNAIVYNDENHLAHFILAHLYTYLQIWDNGVINPFIDKAEVHALRCNELLKGNYNYMSVLVDVYIFKGLLNKALNILTKIKDALNFSHKETVYHYYRRLTEVYRCKNEYNDCINYGKKCLELINSKSVDDDTSVCYLTISYSYLKLNDYENTLKFVQLGLKNVQDTSSIMILEEIKSEILNSK